MRILRPTFLFFLLTVALVASAEVQIIGGKKYECRDGVCMLVEENGEAVGTTETGKTRATENGASRVAQGYMTAESFVAFLENREAKSPFVETGVWLTLLLVLLGGLAMNLTPCVLPMIPINLIVIGRSAARGAAYGLGMAVAYGLLGVGAAVGGLAFGEIQGSPWFNAVIALVFAGLSLALFDVFFIDLSRFRNIRQFDGSMIRRVGFLFPFFMGVVSAVLAGACVAPILISVLLLTGKLYGEGKVLALGLPFVLGFGMALPWPFLGAGMRVLPKPGVWMRGVNRFFGVIVLGFAAWYGWIAWQGFQRRRDVLVASEGDVFVQSDAARTSRPRLEAVPSSLGSQLSILNSKSAKPILVDCWATWCKNCSAMDRVMEEEKVKKALLPYTVLRVQAEDISELRKVKGFESIRGLPAFVIFD